MPMAKAKELVFSVTIKDCEVQTFRSGGKGGQNQNKVESGVRIIHHPSAARGESREYRDQPQNKRAAFERMAKTKTFQEWCKNEAIRLSRSKQERRELEARIDDSMNPENIRVEVMTDEGWRIDNG
jgi:protein subunit release factor B